MIEIERGPDLASKESRSGPVLSIDKVLLILKMPQRQRAAAFGNALIRFQTGYHFMEGSLTPSGSTSPNPSLNELGTTTVPPVSRTLS